MGGVTAGHRLSVQGMMSYLRASLVPHSDRLESGTSELLPRLAFIWRQVRKHRLVVPQHNGRMHSNSGICCFL